MEDVEAIVRSRRVLAEYGEWSPEDQELIVRAMQQYAAGLQGEVERLREALAAALLRLPEPLDDRDMSPSAIVHRQVRTALGDTQ